MTGSAHDASAIFVALLEDDDKDTSLINAVDALRDGDAPEKLFPVDGMSFRHIPASPFAYWATPGLLDAFIRLPTLEGEQTTAKVGLQTSDDFRFLRVWWEVQAASSDAVNTWVGIAKGGAFSRFHCDLYLVVDWANDGERIKGFVGPNGKIVSFTRNPDFYFRPGLTWPRRTNGLSIRAFPSGCIFADKGPVVFIEDDDLTALGSIMAIMNSRVFLALVQMRLARVELAQSYEVGLIQETPVPPLREHASTLADLALRSASLKRSQDQGNEIAHAFANPFAGGVVRRSIREHLDENARQDIEVERGLTALLAEIDDIAAEAYDIPLRDLEASVGLAARGETPDDEPIDDDDLDEVETADSSVAWVHTLLSWALGAVLGRWDIRMAHDPALLPALQGPFDPLPVCAPGALVGPDGLPARPGSIVSEAWLRARPSVIALPPEGSVAEPTIADAAYPLRIDWDGILVDDEGHPDDIVARVREVLGLLWGARAEAIEAEACAILGVGDLREYLRNPRRFWEFHVKRYSKSRRRAPIYWLLQSARRNYALWLYYPRLDADSLYKALRTYVDPKIARERNRLEGLEAERADAEAGGTRARREHERAVDRQRALLGELEAFRLTLERVARHDLTVDHDDGVLLSIAPLHELVPWKPAAQAWRELSEGKYGWSTMAQRMAEKGLTRGGGR